MDGISPDLGNIETSLLDAMNTKQQYAMMHKVLETQKEMGDSLISMLRDSNPNKGNSVDTSA